MSAKTRERGVGVRERKTVEEAPVERETRGVTYGPI